MLPTHFKFTTKASDNIVAAYLNGNVYSIIWGDNQPRLYSIEDAEYAVNNSIWNIIDESETQRVYVNIYKTKYGDLKVDSLVFPSYEKAQAGIVNLGYEFVKTQAIDIT